MQRNRVSICIIGAVLLAVFGFYALHRLLADVSLHDVRGALHALETWRIGLSLALTAASYLVLTQYDAVALRIIGKPLPWRTAALASFTSYTLSHNLGMAVLTGGSARYRIYTAKGLEAADVARIVAIAGMTFWAGVVVTVGAALAIHPKTFAFGPLLLSRDLQKWAGLGILMLAAWLIFMAGRRNRAIRILRWHLPLPTRNQALAQIALASLDLATASAALFVLVPGIAVPMFPTLFLAYALAIIASLVTHLPGGIGIFEAVLIAALPNVDRPSLVAAMIAYRAIYYLLPLLCAALLLVIHERTNWLGSLNSAVRGSKSTFASVAPELLSALTFTGGAILLVSGSLPAIPYRLHALRHLVPLPFVEASQIAASLAGTGLLLLAPGLWRRLDGAFILTRMILIAGAVFSIFKGFDYEEATILLIIAGLLQWSRTSFYRHTAFTMRSFTAEWIAAVAIALGLCLWIGTFAYKHVAFQNDLWWQFAWKGDASRSMRASFGAAVLLIGAIVVRFFGPGVPRTAPCDTNPPDFEPALLEADSTGAMLAWSGDKRFLLSESGNAFVMYQVQGQSWIVMGDPVGPRAEWPDLLWRLRDMAHSCQGRLLLYQITTETLPIAIDIGLQLMKYGEEARVDLTNFSLEGSKARALRHAERRAVREGAKFDIIPAVNVSQFLPELRAISDEWLAAKGQTEKAFSVGRFDPNCLVRNDCAVITEGGRIIAFANIWATANRNELSIDLMRHTNDMPYGTMDFLFIRLMQWGRQQGYRWFSLGIAPLAGIEARRLAPIWARVGALLYKHGDRFYGFAGLRAFKNKFSPTWEPRYVAGPSGAAMLRCLIDLQTLVGGGRGSTVAALVRMETTQINGRGIIAGTSRTLQCSRARSPG